MLSTMAGMLSSAASSMIRRRNTVLPEPVPARIAIWRGSKSAASATGSPNTPRSKRRPIGIERGGAAGATLCAGAASAVRPRLSRCAVTLPRYRARSARFSKRCGPALAVEAWSRAAGSAARGCPFGEDGAGGDRNGGGHRPAALNSAVSNSGLRARSQASKPGKSRSAIARKATKARKSSSDGATNLPPDLAN